MRITCLSIVVHHDGIVICSQEGGDKACWQSDPRVARDGVSVEVRDTRQRIEIAIGGVQGASEPIPAGILYARRGNMSEKNNRNHGDWDRRSEQT